MRILSPFILVSFILSLAAGAASASPTNQGMTVLDRDMTYEQNLRWEASADKAVTPAKVMRWIMSYRGEPVKAPGATEFVPIVNAHDGHIRLIAAIAYKF